MSLPIGRIIFHSSAASIMAYGWFALNELAITALIATQKGGHLQYLTIQGLAITWVTMICSLLLDVAPKFPILKQAKRPLLITALLVSVVISVIYWGLVILVPDLILQAAVSPNAVPSSFEKMPLVRIPLGIDLALHAVPCLSLLIDFFMFENRYSRNEENLVAPLLTAIYVAIYGLWSEYCASFNGSFPYPFLTNNPLSTRALIYIGAGLLGLASFRGLNWLHAERPKQT